MGRGHSIFNKKDNPTLAMVAICSFSESVTQRGGVPLILVNFLGKNMTTKYNPDIIQQFADSLYSQASWIVFVFTILWLFIGCGSGYFVSTRIQNAENDIDKFLIIGAFVGGFIGYNIGQSRAFSLRVRAQRALCQKQIEENTRHSL